MAPFVNNSLSGTNLLRVKDYNQALVIDIVRKRAPVSRRAISDLSGLTFQTVSNIVNRLVKADIIREDMLSTEGGLRPSRLVRLNENCAYALGILFDRSALSVVLTNLSAYVIDQRRIPVPEDNRPPTILPLIQHMTEAIIQQADIPSDKILGVGIGVPGPLDIAAGCLLDVPNFGTWENFPLRSEVEKLLDLPVLLDSDTSAAAMAEKWMGTATSAANFVYIYLGLGIGAGIVMDGQMRRGWNGNVGQIGHLQVEADGPPCYCGKRGCLETYATPASILREAHALLADSDAPLPQTLEEVVQSDDPRLRAILQNATDRVGTVVSGMVGTVDPELIVLGGPMVDLLGKEFREAVIRFLPVSSMPSKPLPDVKISSLGANAGVIGAATLVLHDAYSPSLQTLQLVST